MEAALKIWKTNRILYSKFLEGFTLEQLNKIPEGFNNNLIWNIGHVIAVQQALVYKTAGLDGYLPQDFNAKYWRGTKPNGQATQADTDEVKGLLVGLVDKTMEDFQQGKFEQFHEYKSSYGFLLQSLTDALVFNNYHEGLHMGYMMAIRKFL